MNRPIKFRAWDITGKTMSDVVSIDLGAKARVRVPLQFLCDGEFELMQFTGLLDKNGKEIYEGDVVKFQMKRTKFVDHPVMVATTEETAIYQGAVKWGEFGWRPFADGVIKELEIIGNIYENPELV